MHQRGISGLSGVFKLIAVVSEAGQRQGKNSGNRDLFLPVQPPVSDAIPKGPGVAAEELLYPCSFRVG